jgi:hypothetical protein
VKLIYLSYFFFHSPSHSLSLPHSLLLSLSHFFIFYFYFLHSPSPSPIFFFILPLTPSPSPAGPRGPTEANPSASIIFALSLFCLWLRLWDLLCNAHFDLRKEKGSQAFSGGSPYVLCKEKIQGLYVPS